MQVKVGIFILLMLSTQAFGAEKFVKSFFIRFPPVGASTPESTERTANFDVIIADPAFHATWGEGGANSWNSLRAYNPDIYIALYRLGVNVFGAGLAGTGCAVGGNNMGDGWQWMQDNHGVTFPDSQRWTTRGTTFSYLARSDFPCVVMMRADHPDWHQYWWTNVHADFFLGTGFIGPATRYSGMNGVLADVTNYVIPGVVPTDDWQQFNGTTTLTGPFEKSIDFVANNQALHVKWRKGVRDFISNGNAYLRAQSPPIDLNPNFGSVGLGDTNYADLDCMNNPPVVALSETGWMHELGNFDNPGGGPDEEGVAFLVTGWTTKLQVWSEMKNVMVLIANGGDHHDDQLETATGLARMDIPTDQTGGNGINNTTGWDALWFSMMSTAMAQNTERSNVAMNLTLWYYQEYHWFDELDPAFIHLGDPVGAYFTSGNAYLREYDDGWVVVNPTTSVIASVAVPSGQARVINHSNYTNPSAEPLVTSYSNLGALRGVIFLKDGKNLTNADN